LISHSITYIVVTRLVPDFRILQLFYFFKIIFPQTSHLRQAAMAYFSSFYFRWGLLFRLSGLSVFTPLCIGKFASIIYSSWGTVEFYSTHVSLIIQFPLKVIQVCEDYFIKPLYIAYLDSSPDFIQLHFLRVRIPTEY
jgi:hypothetical protein